MITLYLESNNRQIKINEKHIAWYAKWSDIKDSGIIPGLNLSSDDAVIVMMADKTIFVVKYCTALFTENLNEQSK